MKLVTTIIVNTKGEGEKASEDFWVKAEKLLYTALIAFIWYEGDEEEKNLNTLLDLLNESETREEDETYQNPVDMMFQELEERDPQHFAVRQYKKYKMAAGKTAKSILISCGARLAPFDIAELREIMSYDEMELDKIGDRKTALFLIMSDTDTTFNFVIAIYSHSFSICFAIRQMMNMVEDFRCMCVSSLMSSQQCDTFYAENGGNNRQKRSLKSQII